MINDILPGATLCSIHLIINKFRIPWFVKHRLTCRTDGARRKTFMYSFLATNISPRWGSQAEMQKLFSSALLDVSEMVRAIIQLFQNQNLNFQDDSIYRVRD